MRPHFRKKLPRRARRMTPTYSRTHALRIAGSTSRRRRQSRIVPRPGRVSRSSVSMPVTVAAAPWDCRRAFLPVSPRNRNPGAGPGRHRSTASRNFLNTSPAQCNSLQGGPAARCDLQGSRLAARRGRLKINLDRALRAHRHLRGQPFVWENSPGFCTAQRDRSDRQNHGARVRDRHGLCRTRGTPGHTPERETRRRQRIRRHGTARDTGSLSATVFTAAPPPGVTFKVADLLPVEVGLKDTVTVHCAPMASCVGQPLPCVNCPGSFHCD